MKKMSIVMVLVMLVAAIFAVVTGCAANTEAEEITDIYSETREVLKEKCISLLEENNIQIDNQKIRASYDTGDGALIYFSDYQIVGDYNTTFYVAMVGSPDDKFAQAEAIELLNRVKFKFINNTIVYEDVIDSEFDESKSEVKNVESEFKELFKKDLIDFLKTQGHKCSVEDAFIKVSEENGYSISFSVKERKDYSIESIKEYSIHFNDSNELKKIAEALINGDEIRLPDYEYKLNGTYIEVE